jgi:hypothetical protein
MAISTGVRNIDIFNKKAFHKVSAKKSDKKKTNSDSELVFYSFIPKLHVWRFISIDFFACPG